MQSPEALAANNVNNNANNNRASASPFQAQQEQVV